APVRDRERSHRDREWHGIRPRRLAVEPRRAALPPRGGRARIRPGVDQHLDAARPARADGRHEELGARARRRLGSDAFLHGAEERLREVLSRRMRTITLSLPGVDVTADLDRAFDLAIPLRFDGAQPSAFGAPPATAEPLRAGAFVGDVARGG